MKQGKPTNQDAGVGSVILQNYAERIKKPARDFLVVDHVRSQDEVAFGDFSVQLLSPTIYLEEVNLLYFDNAFCTNLSIGLEVVTNGV